MKQSLSPLVRRSLTPLLAILLVVAITTIVGLIINLQTLSTEKQRSEEQVSALQTKIARLNTQRCTSQHPWQANTTKVFTVATANGSRMYRAHLPKNYSPDINYPAILSFDGIDGSARKMERYSQLNSLPAIVIYPEPTIGLRGITSWQGAPYSARGVSDIQFVSDIIDDIQEQVCVNPQKIYSVGMSNGGGFAWLAGCYLSNKIAAVASVSGAYYTSCPEQKRSIPVLAIHSDADANVPFDGNKIRKLPQVLEWAGKRATENLCQPEPQLLSGVTNTRYIWQNCERGASVELVQIHHQKHGWLRVPQLSRDPNARQPSTAQFIWEFFERTAT